MASAGIWRESLFDMSESLTKSLKNSNEMF